MNENLNMETKEIKELIIHCVDECAEYEMYPKDIFNEIYEYIDKWYKDENQNNLIKQLNNDERKFKLSRNT